MAEPLHKFLAPIAAGLVALRRLCRVIAAGVAVAGLSSINGALSAETINHHYAVELMGLPIGRAIIEVSLEPKRYAAKARANVGWLGLERRIESVVSGGRAGSKLRPDAFRMVIAGGTPTTVAIKFNGQSPARYTINPPVDAASLRDRVPITDGLLKGVVDPLSALISTSLAADRDPARLCRAQTSVFIGFARFDVRLEPTARGAAEASPDFVTCRVFYKPVAGHPSEREEQRHDGPRPTANVTFQWIDRDRIWAVSRISMPLKLGSVTVQRVDK